MSDAQIKKATTPNKAMNPILLGLVLLFAGVSVTLVQYKIPTILTDLEATFQIGSGMGGWLMSIFVFMYVFFAIPAGRLCQKFGPKKVAIAAMFISVIGSALGLAAYAVMSGPLLLVSRAFEGTAQCILVTAGPIAIQKSVGPDKLSTTMGIWGCWGCIGSTAGSQLTPTLFGAFGFPGLWISYGAVVIIAIIVVALVLKVPSESLAPGAYNEEEPAVKPRYRELFTRDIALFFIAFMIYNLALLAVLSYVPTILQAHGWSQRMSGFASTCPQLIAVASGPLFGAIADRTGHIKPLLILAIFAMGPTAFVMYNFTGSILWVAIVVMGVCGMGGVGLLLSAFTVIMPRPELSGIAMGVMMCFQGIGSFFGAWLMQVLLGPSLTNYMLAGTVVLVLGVIASICIALVRVK